MRYADRITFRALTKAAAYNPDTGTTDPAQYTDTTMPCDLGPVSIERTARLFGDVTIRASVARLQRPYTGRVDEVLVNGRPFQVLREIEREREGPGAFYLQEIKG